MILQLFRFELVRVEVSQERRPSLVRAGVGWLHVVVIWGNRRDITNTELVDGSEVWTRDDTRLV